MQVVWSVKGGVGASVVAAALAAGWARRGERVVLVDLCGDAPAVLGRPEPPGPGVAEWLGSDDAEAASLSRLVHPVSDGLGVVPVGSARVTGCSDARARALACALLDVAPRVVVDAGRPDGATDGSRSGVLSELLACDGRSLLVTRACYLALRRAVRAPWTADAAVLVVEPGRALDGRDVADVLGVPVVAEVPHDPAVARSVDAGTLVRRTPRVLERSLGPLW